MNVMVNVLARMVMTDIVITKIEQSIKFVYVRENINNENY